MRGYYDKLPGDEPFEMECVENLDEKQEIKVSFPNTDQLINLMYATQCIESKKCQNRAK